MTAKITIEMVEELLKEVPTEVTEKVAISYATDHLITQKYLNLLVKAFADEPTTRVLVKLPKQSISKVANQTLIEKRHVRVRTIMLLSLFKHGKEVFGSISMFRKWLRKPNYMFDEKPPINLLKTFPGIRFVDNSLTAMQYGDNA